MATNEVGTSAWEATREILRRWSPSRAHFSRTGLLLSGKRGAIQAQNSRIKLTSGSSPTTNPDILIRNQDILMQNQDVLTGNQDILISFRDILISYRDILISYQDILISYQDILMQNRART